MSSKPPLRLPSTFPTPLPESCFLRKLFLKLARWMLPSSGQMCPYSVSQFERSREQDPSRRPHILLAFFCTAPSGSQLGCSWDVGSHGLCHRGTAEATFSRRKTMTNTCWHFVLAQVLSDFSAFNRHTYYYYPILKTRKPRHRNLKLVAKLRFEPRSL